MQITAGALTGTFGPRAKYWGEKFLGEGHTHIIASDAHSAGRRLPRLSETRAIAAGLLGEAEAQRLVVGRPQGVLDNRPPQEMALPRQTPRADSLMVRLRGKWRLFR